MITIFAPDGVGEVRGGADLAGLIIEAVAADPAGPLRDGDVVVVTSKIISKAADQSAAARDRPSVLAAETTYTVARRGEVAIVRDRRGLTLAGAGIDNSNIAPDRIVVLPVDPDAAAARLCTELRERTGLRLGVVVSDTAGRAWRVGQTDHAIGAAGVEVLRRYAGVHDPYGNELQITEMALADELAAAADLAKEKVTGRPVAVVRGLGHLLDSPGRAADLVRPLAMDLFGFGAREAVLAATLTALGRLSAYEDLVGQPAAQAREAVLDMADLGPEARELLSALLCVDLRDVSRRLAQDRGAQPGGLDSPLLPTDT